MLVWALLHYDGADKDALFRLKDMVREVIQDTSGLRAYVRVRDANVPVALRQIEDGLRLVLSL